MRKALIIGLIVCVLAVGGIGAAFATGMNFTNVGALSLGRESVDQVDVDYIGYELETGAGYGVRVDGVYISFLENVGSPSGGNDTVIFVSLRGAENVELAYCVALVPAGQTLTAATTYKFPCADGTTALPEDILQVKVTVAENSAYEAPPQGHLGEGTVVPMPGAY